MHRFFAPTLDPGDETIDLPREEAEHLTRVLRLGAGDAVTVFDGRGREFLARVVSTTGRAVKLQVGRRTEPVAESLVSLTLVQAVLKADKFDEVVRDSVMLGVSAIQPIVTGRTETTVAALMRGARLDRWRRVALASAKQSGRAVLPEIRTPLTFDDWLAEPRPPATLMLVEPRATADVEPLSIVRDAPVPSEAAIVVGPEGGWTESEWSAARSSGLRLVTFGPRTLRADAVPLAVLSVLQFSWS